MKINNVLLFALLALAGNASAMQNDDLGEQLLDAAQEGKHEVVASLLDRGVPVDYVNCNRSTALIIAAMLGNKSVVQLLLDRGAAVNYADSDGETALLPTARWGHQPVVQLLLDRGAAVNYTSNDGWTALKWAEQKGHPRCCETIVDRLMKMPNEMQRKKIYLLLWHMKNQGLGRDIYYIMKPHLIRMLDQENRAKPEHSIAFREIHKIKNNTIKLNLLEKYTPMKNNDEVGNENK